MEISKQKIIRELCYFSKRTNKFSGFLLAKTASLITTLASGISGLSIRPTIYRSNTSSEMIFCAAGLSSFTSLNGSVSVIFSS